MRNSGYFSEIGVPLHQYENPPTDLLGNVVVEKDGAVETRYLRTRGVVTAEDVLYGPRPSSIRRRWWSYEFSRAELVIARTFTSTFWAAWAAALVVYVVPILGKTFGFTISLPH